MDIFIGTHRSSTELIAGVGQAKARQHAPEGFPVYTPDTEARTSTQFINWRLTQTDGPATVETDCTTENLAIKLFTCDT